jgi:phosphate transport system substrate-binding protein
MISLRIWVVASLTSVMLSAPTWAGSEPLPTVKIDGSSTVYPITQAALQAFETEHPQMKGAIAVTFSGTGGGFKKFCRGETDVSNASRPILLKEMKACREANVAFMELPIGFDALTLVVNPKNTWAQNISVAELRKIWEAKAQGKILLWSQVRSFWPNRPLKLFGPGRDSGTYDYFVEAILGSGGASRSDYTASEDDNDLVKGVSEDPDALGYFGYAYYEANRTKLKALAVDSGRGPILPSRTSVEKNQYQPLSRPLFLYVNIVSSQNKIEVRDFVDYYLQNAERFVQQVGYVPLPAEGYHITHNHFWRGKRGSVFAGRSYPGLTIRQLLLKEASF